MRSTPPRAARSQSWRKRLVLLAAVLISSIALSSSAASRLRDPHAAFVGAHVGHQHGDHADQTGAGSAAMVLAIDGARTPEAISDEYAYHLFLGAIASQQSGAAWQTVLRSAGIDQGDAARFGAALAPLRLELGAIAQQRSAGADRGVLHDRERNALALARVQVQTTLSVEGRVRLDQYVRERVKSRIRIYRGPMPTAAQP